MTFHHPLHIFPHPELFHHFNSLAGFGQFIDLVIENEGELGHFHDSMATSQDQGGNARCG